MGWLASRQLGELGFFRRFMGFEWWFVRWLIGRFVGWLIGWLIGRHDGSGRGGSG
jgi:hypothetical protein